MDKIPISTQISSGFTDKKKQGKAIHKIKSIKCLYLFLYSNQLRATTHIKKKQNPVFLAQFAAYTRVLYDDSYMIMVSFLEKKEMHVSI